MSALVSRMGHSTIADTSRKVRVPKLEQCCVSFYLFSFSIFFLCLAHFSLSLDLSLSLSPCDVACDAMLCCVSKDLEQYTSWKVRIPDRFFFRET